ARAYSPPRRSSALHQHSDSEQAEPHAAPQQTLQRRSDRRQVLRDRTEEGREPEDGAEGVLSAGDHEDQAVTPEHRCDVGRQEDRDDRQAEAYRTDEDWERRSAAGAEPARPAIEDKQQSGEPEQEEHGVCAEQRQGRELPDRLGVRPPCRHICGATPARCLGGLCLLGKAHLLEAPYLLRGPCLRRGPPVLGSHRVSLMGTPPKRRLASGRGWLTCESSCWPVASAALASSSGYGRGRSAAAPP